MKIFKGNKQFPVPKILNSFSPRLFSFIISVGEERFINPFLKLLNFLDKNAKVP